MIPRRFFLLFDALVLFASFVLAYILTPYWHYPIDAGGPLVAKWIQALSVPSQPGVALPPVSNLLWVFLSMAPVTILCLEALGNYAPLIEQSLPRAVIGAFAAPIGGLCLISSILFALKAPGGSRLFTFSFVAFSSLGLTLYRGVLCICAVRQRAAGHYARNVLFVGTESGIEWMLEYFSKNISTADYRPFAYLRITEAQNRLSGGGQIRELGSVRDLGELLIHQPIHEVIVVHPIGVGDWITQVIRECDYFGVTLRIVPEALLLQEQRSLQILYPLEPPHLPAVILRPAHWNSEALFVKRLIDIVVSMALLILLSPIFLIIAIAIKLTTPSLPVFYRWHVVGRNGVEFTGYKFTTMISNSDHLLSGLQSRNEMVGPVFKIREDPRVTSLGRFLRRYSLNELPQLWSVLKGDMSLVGPRPAFRHELERYEFWHKRKLTINPGITCLWQIRGRNRINHFDDWVKMDLEYIDNWSLWLDFKILIRTAWVVLSGTGY